MVRSFILRRINPSPQPDAPPIFLRHPNPTTRRLAFIYVAPSPASSRTRSSANASSSSTPQQPPQLAPAPISFARARTRAPSSTNASTRATVYLHPPLLRPRPCPRPLFLQRLHPHGRLPLTPTGLTASTPPPSQIHIKARQSSPSDPQHGEAAAIMASSVRATTSSSLLSTYHRQSSSHRPPSSSMGHEHKVPSSRTEVDYGQENNTLVTIRGSGKFITHIPFCVVIGWMMVLQI